MESIVLNNPSQWPTWYKVFQGKATDLDVWEQVDPGAENPEKRMPKPEPPAFSDYKKKGIPRHTRGSIIEVLQTPDIEELRSDYNHDIRIYEREAAALRELRNWVLSTAAEKYVNACCKPTETLQAWMVKLKGVASISNNKQKSAAREEYEKTVKQAATKRITTKAEIENWLEQWEAAMLKGQETAISAFHATFEAKFHESDNPSISEISAEVRRYIRIHADTLSTGPRASRGAFATTREGPKETMPRSTTKKRHRAADSRTQNEMPTCHGCDLPRHLLANCFYCFPEEAYEGWRPSNDIMKKVTERLKADDDLADRVKKIRFVTQAKQRHTSFTPRKRLAGRPFRWHQRLGHPGEGVLEHLVNASRGVKIMGDLRNKLPDCSACGKGKTRRIVRRAPRESIAWAKPGSRVAFDFHSISPQGYGGYMSTVILSDRLTGYSWDYYLKDRTTETLLEVFDLFMAMMKTQYNIQVKVFECDREVATIHQQVATHLQSQGVVLEPSAPNTQAQNGGAERIAAVIKEKARTLREAGKFPEMLWPEIVVAATYLYNRTPSAARGWKTPFERFHNQFRGPDLGKPHQAHLRAYGCKMYALTTDAQLGRNKSRKLQPRGWIGYLIGYSTSNSYRVWNPLTARVITTRDVVFRETEFFNGDINELRDDLKDLDVNELNALLARLEVSPTGITSPEYAHTADEEVDEVQYIEDEEAQEYTAPPSPKYVESRFELNTPPRTPPTSFFAGLEEALGVKGWRKRRASIAPEAVHARESIHEEFPITTPRTSWQAAFLGGTRTGRKRVKMKQKAKNADTSLEAVARVR
nr:polyprotein [Colletotrichum truncatum]KAF6799616.1 polyprotein [Colletotrichum truncatum]